MHLTTSGAFGYDHSPMADLDRIPGMRVVSPRPGATSGFRPVLAFGLLGFLGLVAWAGGRPESAWEASRRHLREESELAAQSQRAATFQARAARRSVW